MSSRTPTYHIPVLIKELLEWVDPTLALTKNWIVDATLGDGGHSIFLRKAYPHLSLLGCDRDPEMLARSIHRLTEAGIAYNRYSCQEQLDLADWPPGKLLLLEQNYRQLAELLVRWQIEPQLILLDLGVASYHFKEAGRGFSYLDEALDMRLDPQTTQKAADILNRATERELAQIFYEKGEERYARPIARAIVQKRPLHSARQLAEVVSRTISYRRRNYSSNYRGNQRSQDSGHRNRSDNRSGIHPATRVFQALRIVVNDELAALQEALEKLPYRLAPGGILAVISFHSLEDRIVKHCFRKIGYLPANSRRRRNKNEEQGKNSKNREGREEQKERENRENWQDSREDHPGQEDEEREMSFQILNRRPITPGNEETTANPAARSARMRLLQRL